MAREFHRVEVNGIDACSAPIVAKANEFFYQGKYWCIPENFPVSSRDQQVEWLENVALWESGGK